MLGQLVVLLTFQYLALSINFWSLILCKSTHAGKLCCRQEGCKVTLKPAIEHGASRLVSAPISQRHIKAYSTDWYWLSGRRTRCFSLHEHSYIKRPIIIACNCVPRLCGNDNYGDQPSPWYNSYDISSFKSWMSQVQLLNIRPV